MTSGYLPYILIAFLFLHYLKVFTIKLHYLVTITNEGAIKHIYVFVYRPFWKLHREDFINKTSIPNCPSVMVHINLLHQTKSWYINWFQITFLHKNMENVLIIELWSGEKLWYSQLIYTWMNIVHKVLKLKSSKWVLAITQILWETYTIKCDHHKTPTPII